MPSFNERLRARSISTVNAVYGAKAVAQYEAIRTRSISNDDLCASCVHLEYRPAGMSTCVHSNFEPDWEKQCDNGGQVVTCEAYVEHTDADDNAALNIKRRGITLIRSDAFSKEKTVRAVSIRKEKKAQELASSGDGDNVRLALGRATVDDVLNSESISA
jgi:hypothetical protein